MGGDPNVPGKGLGGHRLGATAQNHRPGLLQRLLLSSDRGLAARGRCGRDRGLSGDRQWYHWYGRDGSADLQHKRSSNPPSLDSEAEAHELLRCPRGLGLPTNMRSGREREAHRRLHLLSVGHSPHRQRLHPPVRASRLHASRRHCEPHREVIVALLSTCYRTSEQAMDEGCVRHLRNCPGDFGGSSCRLRKRMDVQRTNLQDGVVWHSGGLGSRAQGADARGGSDTLPNAFAFQGGGVRDGRGFAR
mmetsp:Transcript_68455/g.149501  ORF Transcript_68455/g.149501 Transcript_68455/m.149501 type:complete len:247 (+) Transcript_68455:362-1102(+)